MKSRIKEQGSSAHIIIVVVLVVALVGALGFIFWQNFINKPAESTVQTTETTKTDETKQSPKSFAIAEWGVSIPVEGNYTFVAGDSTHGTIYSKELTQLEKDLGCTEQNGVSISRSQTVEDMPDYLKADVSPKANGYYFVLIHSNQTLCVGAGGDTGPTSDDVNDLYELEFSKLKVALKSVVETQE